MNKEPIATGIDIRTTVEVQLAPFGDWPQTAEDKDGNPVEIVQHVTPETMGRVVEAFSEKVVVDVDHKSADGTDSRAAAWVKGLRADPERGLVGEFEFTPYGAELVGDREYRFVSVEWWVDDDGNPVELAAVALTNRPNLPVSPIINAKKSRARRLRNCVLMRAASSAEEIVLNAAKRPEEAPAEPQPTKESSMDPEEQKKPAGSEAPAETAPKAEEKPSEEARGTSAEEEALRAENAELKSRCEALEAEVARLKADAEAEKERKQGEEAEAYANECGVAEEDRETFKNAYLASPGTVRSLMNMRLAEKPAAEKPAAASGGTSLENAVRAAARSGVPAAFDPKAREVLKAYNAMKPGPDKDRFFDEHKREIIAADKAGND